MIVLNEAMLAKISAKKQADQAKQRGGEDTINKTHHSNQSADAASRKRLNQASSSDRDDTPMKRQGSFNSLKSAERIVRVEDSTHSNKASENSIKTRPAPVVRKPMTLAEKLAAKRAAQKSAAATSGAGATASTGREALEGSMQERKLQLENADVSRAREGVSEEHNKDSVEPKVSSKELNVVPGQVACEKVDEAVDPAADVAEMKEVSPSLGESGS